MESNEALNQIAYVRDLLTKTRLSSAEGYPYFILWGIIWILGYIGSIWIPPYLWSGLCLIGGIGSFFIGKRRKWKPTDLKLLKQLAIQALILFMTSLPIYALLFFSKLDAIIYAFWPFEIGIIYMVIGVFMGKDLMGIGSGLVFAALISLLLPNPFQFIWLAIIGGGGLLMTGIIFRNQVKKSGLGHHGEYQ